MLHTPANDTTQTKNAAEGMQVWLSNSDGSILKPHTNHITFCQPAGLQYLCLLIMTVHLCQPVEHEVRATCAAQQLRFSSWADARLLCTGVHQMCGL